MSSDISLLVVEDLGPVGFADAHTLAADGTRTWSADRIIVAVGGHAGRLQIPGADLGLTYEDIPSLDSLPRYGERTVVLTSPTAGDVRLGRPR